MGDPIQELAELFSRLPGIGKRTATRLVFHLLNTSPDYAGKLGSALSEFHSKIQKCDVCANISQQNPCPICSDPIRNQQIICVVENIPDLWAIETGGTYKGHYHVLHGLLAPLDGIGPDDLNIPLLEKAVVSKQATEIIVATRPSVEGEATALLIRQQLSHRGIKITRIASGIPHGSELEYTDARTLERALDDRREI